MAAMKNIDFSKAESRMDVDMMLADSVKSARVRQFLLKNVTRDEQNGFRWKINLETLHNELPHILDGLNTEDFKAGNAITGFPVLFIRGAGSDYIQDIDLQAIRTIFPAASVVTIPNAGHWVHAEQTELFLKNVTYFLGAG
jgi:pimeloyl-ACP methyl ester carboxylesterase